MALIAVRLPMPLPAQIGSGLDAFVEAGDHGDMGWLEHVTRPRRYSPDTMWEDARTAIVFGCNYGLDHNPLDTLEDIEKANISVYARVARLP